MALMEKKLKVKKSSLPGAGKGLFTTAFIPKGTRIVEYKGKITTWKEVQHDNGANGYIYYVKRNHVIDAGKYTRSLARYANDGRGLRRTPGVANNAEYVEDDGRVYIEAVKDIPAGSEILVSYGKEYWDAIRHNIKLARRQQLRSGRHSISRVPTRQKQSA